MSKKETKCDCLLGNFSGENLTKSNIKWEIESAAKIQKRLFDAGIFGKGKTPDTPIQIIDGRKGYVSRFKFCPYCGVKTDWEAIVNDFKNV